MIRLPAPSALNGDQLQDELAAAGVSDATVTLNGDTVEIVAENADQATAESVVAAHVPPAPEPPVAALTDDEIAALRSMLATR
jgi:hypothetical protein